MSSTVRKNVSIFLIVLMSFRTMSFTGLSVIPVPYGIENILRRCSVQQVIKLIIIRIAIPMANLFTFGTWSYKSFGDQPMDVSVPPLAVNLEGYTPVTIFVQPAS